MAPARQSYANHARYVPLYHFVLGGLLGFILIYSGIQLVKQFSIETLSRLAVAIALVLVAFYARAFALSAQDRVIRLEMQLRMQRLLPAEVVARFAEFTPAQLVALRFAGDAELPALARRVLEGALTTPAAIKREIRDWRADPLRV